MVTFGLDPAPRAADFGLNDGAIRKGKETIVAVAALKVSGLHNMANAMAALALCDAVGVAPSRLLAPLKAFAGLPHRVETVVEIAGVAYIDDSKGTNVGATLAAIEGMGRKVAIILGGDGKGQDFSPLKPALEKHGRAVALIGRDAGAIEAAITGCGLPLQHCDDMNTAVRWLSGQAREGDCVLLSPACASFDMYRNYGERAAVFVAAVKGLSS